MVAVRVFDPAMCCSTGICGPSIDPQLVRFAADLDWLKTQGVSVERFNLSQQPAAFADDAAVKTALETKGEAGLPLVKVNGEVKSSGLYPSRDELAAWAGVGASAPSIFTEAVAELVALGASVVSSCDPCFKFHYDKARKLGVSKEDMALAVTTAKMVKESPARAIVALAEKYLGTTIATKEGPDASQPAASATASACCPPTEAAPVSIGKPGGAPKKCC